MRRGQTNARLTLRKQTLRALTVRELSHAVGGYYVIDDGGGSWWEPPPPPDDTSMTQGPLGQSGCCNCL